MNGNPEHSYYPDVSCPACGDLDGCHIARITPSTVPITNKQTLQQIAAAEMLGWEPTPEGSFHPDNPTGQTMPNFHTDANASLQLIEWMREKGWGLHINNDLKVWRVWFHHSKHDAVENFGKEDSFPLAILNAFLRANGREDLL